MCIAWSVAIATSETASQPYFVTVPLPRPTHSQEEAGAGGGAAPSKQGRLAGLASTAIDFAAWGLGSLMPRRP